MPGYLQRLEAESIFILRETAAQFQNPTLLYSVGKDSSVLLHLCRKAFAPAQFPFPLLHVDTGFKFDEMYEVRDRIAQSLGARLLVHTNVAAKENDANPYSLGTKACCGLLKTTALLQALRENQVDAAIGGARRDEERSRAKERIFSHRDIHGQWDPRQQRPELWRMYNAHLRPGESLRIFPLSNWTEFDVWLYIALEEIPVVPLYFAKEREVLVRGKYLLPYQVGLTPMMKGDNLEKVMCRYRSLGCIPCTGAVRSEAITVPQIVEELSQQLVSERATRVIDHDSDASMERKKREGYF